MKTAIAIFCKTPGLSPVKTRLGAEIGIRNAEEFYKLSLSAVRETVQLVMERYPYQLDAYWAVAEKEAAARQLWQFFPCIWTGEGGLGERIYHVFEELFCNYDQVIILGSDSPQISPDYILEALDKLGGSFLDGVVGPCRDGGFVLFGSKTKLEKPIWTSVEYSREDTLKQLTMQLEHCGYRYQSCSELGDVDTYEDLIRLINDYKELGDHLQPQQRILFYWLQEILISKILYRKVMHPCPC